MLGSIAHLSDVLSEMLGTWSIQPSLISQDVGWAIQIYDQVYFVSVLRMWSCWGATDFLFWNWGVAKLEFGVHILLV